MVLLGRTVVLLALTFGLLAGCGPAMSPFEETPPGVVPPDRVPVVLVPGVSREVAALLRGGRLVPFTAMALRTDSDALAHLGDPRFAADGGRSLELPRRLDSALRGESVRGLQVLIDRLVREEGYLRGNPEQPLDKDYPENPEAMRKDRTRLASLFVVYYDWRRDISESACLLANRMERIRARTGAPRAYLIGHSLGGVVARYYARYGGRDVVGNRDCPLSDGTRASAVNAPGGSSIAGLVSLGAPHRGSAQALRALLQDFNLFGMLSVGLRDAAFTLPMAWQILPVAEADGRLPLLVGPNGNERVALYDPQTWLERGWVAGDAEDPERRRFLGAMLDRARSLQTRLQEPNGAEGAVPRLVLGSACRPTLARAIVENGTVAFLSRGQADHPLFGRTTVPGDGVVSLDRALGMSPSPTRDAVTVCTGHGGYVEDPAVVDRIVRFVDR
jgi:pimeloyl-ACP methyl ester carboxylesterase